jgi:hypothetical protein
MLYKQNLKDFKDWCKKHQRKKNKLDTSHSKVLSKEKKLKSNWLILNGRRIE